jgi:glucose-6-phosphate isomerase
LKIDLSSIAGFPLELDTEALGIATGDGIRFDRAVRRKPQMQAVLMEPEAIGDNAELYYNFVMESAGIHAGVFHGCNLTFACVLLPPLKIGQEYVKTHGHYHPVMPGSTLAYPEVYTHYYGKLYLLMHRRIDDDPARLDDCVFYEMQAGHSVTIPPGYLHVLINPSNEPALMGGLYCPDSYPEYQPVIQMGGAAFYVVSSNGKEKVVENSRYQVCPPLVTLGDLAGSMFAPPHDDTPLWASLVQEPQAYAMLADATAAQRRFRPEVPDKTIT